jgi:peptide/nickel transport system substrate-binding protein
VSAAIDREAIVKIAFQGLGTPLWGNVTPGNKLWFDATLPRAPRSLERARGLLKKAGFRWDAHGGLLDEGGKEVEFSLIVAASSRERTQMATIIQDDLKQLGMQVTIAPLEFRSLVDRVMDTHQYDAAIFGLGGGDADPNGEMNVWTSSGTMHVWSLGNSQPATAWETEIDQLMKQQLVTLDYSTRKRLYDRVQRIVGEQLPVICLASPHVLVAAKAALGNLQPAVLDPYALWNVDQLFWSLGAGR